MSLPDAPMQIPPDFGKGGADLSEGTPSLNAIPKNWQGIINAAYEQLQTPAGGKQYAFGLTAGQDSTVGPGPWEQAGHAPLGYIVKSYFKFQNSDTGGPQADDLGVGGARFESPVSEEGSIKQLPGFDLTGSKYIIFYESP